MGLMDIAHTSEINKSDYTLPIFLENEDKIKILEIEHPYNMEMLCDWVGAAKAQGKFPPKDDKYFYTRKWYSAHKNKMQLHPNTREFIEKTIGIGKENA